MIPPSIRSAVDIKTAVDTAADLLEPIGYCATKEDAFFRGYGSERKTKDRSALDVMEMLENLYSQHNVSHLSGVLDKAFTLSITCPGYEFLGEITPIANRAQEEVDKTKKGLELQLREWYERGTTSGYGDIRAQETKIDPEIRDAREFGVEEFSVSAGLAKEIEAKWAAHFYPTTVRAEPYKIHLYGPHGGFDVHRDTPEKDLVGTFLVGLGDTRQTPTLRVGSTRKTSERYYATRGNWVAFYPDEEHEIWNRDGYRAVIAFKLFRTSLNEEVLAPAASLVRTKIRDALAPIHHSFGLLLDRKYCIDTAEPSGFDAHLVAALHLREGCDVHLLPVLTEFRGRYDYREEERQSLAKVYPLSQTHIDAVLALTRTRSHQEHMYWSKKVHVELAGTGMDWLSRRATWEIPFYSVDLEKTAVTWSREQREEGHTGNECRALQEDSIYLSYAVVVVNTQKRKFDDGDDDDEAKGEVHAR